MAVTYTFKNYSYVVFRKMAHCEFDVRFQLKNFLAALYTYLGENFPRVYALLRRTSLNANKYNLHCGPVHAGVLFCSHKIENFYDYV